PDDAFLRSKTKGLLIGSFFGDALGGPIEFQDHEQIQKTPGPPKLWKRGEVISPAEIQAAAARLWLREYRHLRTIPESYGQWAYNGEPGTVTDDSRHKMVLIGLLRQAEKAGTWPIGPRDMASSYLAWRHSPTIVERPQYHAIVDEWLGETYRAANWLLGSRDTSVAYPTERLWNGLPTCYGQMAQPPLAAIFPGRPQDAYLAAYHLGFYDNGWGKDMNAALVAGLAEAMVIDVEKTGRKAAWERIFKTMRETDPYGYNRIPWTPRSVPLWLDLADSFVLRSEGQPAILFDILNEELKYDIKWEAHVPFVVIFSVLKICDYDPLAALQLSIEWGHDHDSYAQLLGAFVGALHGESLLKQEWQDTVHHRLKLDYGEDWEEWTNLLVRLRGLAGQQQLVKID
nr:ADP-ribosylglycohydrolase family protein [Saprospiraceae bacterium]